MPGLDHIESGGDRRADRSRPPRGWYPDPAQSSRIRFWTGDRWTRDVADRRPLPTLAEGDLRAELEGFVDRYRRTVHDDTRLDDFIPAYLEARYHPAWHLAFAPGFPVAHVPDPSRRLDEALAPPPPAGAPPAPPETVRPAVPVPEPRLVAVEPPATIPEDSAAPVEPQASGALLQPTSAPSPAAEAPPATIRSEPAPVRPFAAPLVVPAGDEPPPPRIGAGEVRAVTGPQDGLPAPQEAAPPHPSLWIRARRAAASDLTVHGLAYLGVLLVFAGVFGLLVFSWGEVGSAFQPIAELAVPTVLLGGGVLLSRRGSVIVGNSLLFVGAAVLPFVAIASVADGSPVPPDAHHAALVASAATAFFATGLGLVLVSLARPDTVLRFLVAPMLWFGVAMAALAARSDEVVGDAVARPSSGQVAIVLGAIAATAWLTHLRRSHPLAVATRWAAVAGLSVFALLAAVLAVREPWPLDAVVLGALALVVGLEAVADLLPDTVVAIGQVLGTAAAFAVLGAWGEPSWAGALGVAAMIAVLEWEGLRRPRHTALLFAATGLAGALAVATLEPWPSVIGWAGATMWAVGVHVGGRTWFPATLVDPLAGALSLGIVVGLFRALDPGAAALTTAATVAVVAVVCHVLAPHDRLARWWVPSAAVGVLLLPAPLLATASAGSLALTALLGCVAVSVAPLTAVWRLWLVWAGLLEAGVLAVVAFDLAVADVAIALGATGVLAILLAVPRLRLAGHLALQGHLTTFASVLVAIDASDDGRGWPVTIGLTALVAGLLVTSWRDRDEPAPAIEVLGSLTADGSVTTPWRTAFPAAMIAGLPVVAVSLADSAVHILDDRARTGLLLGAVAVVLSGATWAVRARRRVLVPLQVVAVATSAVALAVTIASPNAATVAGAALAWVGLLPAPAVRWASVTALGWLATGYTAVRAADALGLAAERWCLVSLGWAATLLTGALAVDRAVAGERSAPGWIRDRRSLAPALLGALAFAPSLALTYQLDSTTWAWTSLAAAAVTCAVAVLTHAGAVSIASWVLASVGAAELAPFSPLDHPELLVGVGAMLVGASTLLAKVRPARGLGNWDLPPLVVGTAVTLTAVVAAVPESMWSTWLAAGGLAIVVAVLRREPPWVVAGVLLVNAAAAAASSAWLTASLATTSVAATAGAVVWQGPGRRPLRLVGVLSALAAYQTLLVDQGVLDVEGLTTGGVIAAALTGGPLLLGLALAARLAGLHRRWLIPWSTAATLLIVQAAASLGDVDRRPAGLAVAAALALCATATALAAAPLHLSLLRPATTYLTAAAALAAGWAIDAPPGPTSAALAATSLALALTWRTIRHHTPWDTATLHAVALTTITAPLLAATAPALGWLTIALVSTSTVTTLLSTTPTDTSQQTLLRLVGVLSALAAYQTLLLALGWLRLEPELAVGQSLVTAGTIGAATVALLLVVAARWYGLDRSWVLPWTAGTALVVVQALLLLPSVDRLQGGLAAAGGLLLSAGAAALAARPLGLALLRESAAVLVAGSATTALWAIDADPVLATAAAVAMALTATAITLTLHPARPGSPWLRPFELLSGIGAVAAVAVGATAWPDRAPLVGALLTAAAVSAAIGITRRILVLQTAVPVLLCAAWLVSAIDLARGESLWFTVPVAIALFMIAGLGRSAHHRLGGAGTPQSYLLVESAGYVALLLPPLVELGMGQLGDGLVAVAFGFGLAGWGIIGQVRRRLVVGVVSVLVAVVLLLGVPLVEWVPLVESSGLAIWLTILVAGVIVIAVAGVLERGRAAGRKVLTRFSALTEGWE